MLENYRKGYAVMTPQLDAYSFRHEDLATCKKYCNNNNVVVELIPRKVGFSITFLFNKIEKHELIYFSKLYCRFLWIKFYFNVEIRHRKGSVVHDPGNLLSGKNES